MSAKTDLAALRLIGEEVVRLLNLPADRFEDEASKGLRMIAALAQWRDELAKLLPKAAGQRFR